jgi:hypothetical protein
MTTTMRAKVRVSNVEAFKSGTDGVTTSENLTFNPVAKSDGPYPADGSDEDNTFAKWSPGGEFKLSVTNPSLFGKFTVGQKFYVDFAEVPAT